MQATAWGRGINVDWAVWSVCFEPEKVLFLALLEVGGVLSSQQSVLVPWGEG